MARAEIKPDSLTPLEEKVRKAAVDVEAKRQVLEAAIETRDAGILELYDSGCPLARAAKVSLVSMQRIMQIVARRG